MKLRAYGMAVDPPGGWEVRIARRAGRQQPGEQTPAVLHAATVPLPEQRGDFGGDVTPLLGREDVFVSLFEYEPEAARTALFATVGRPRPTAADFSPAQLQRTIRGQSGRQYFFQEAGRAFCLYAVLGSHARRAPLVARLNPLLDTLVLDGAVPR